MNQRKHPNTHQSEFTVIIQDHERLLFKVCSMYSSNEEEQKDLFQEIILQAWKSYATFQGRSMISTWLYRVAFNTAINYTRKQKRQPLTIHHKPTYDLPDDTMPHEWKEQLTILHQIIDELPKLDKALVLLYLEDKSYNEIAEIIGISQSNVGTRLNRIKDKMKQKAKILTN